MEDASAAVTALKCTVIVAVRILIKFDAVFDKLLNILRRLRDENLQRLWIIGKRASDTGIIGMQLNVIAGGVPDTGDTALCERRITECCLAFCEQQHAEMSRQMQCGIAAGSACTGNDNVIILFEIHHRNGSFESIVPLLYHFFTKIAIHEPAQIIMRN